MGDQVVSKTSWKDRLVDSWHQPWPLRKRSSNITITRDTKKKSNFSQRRKRRPVSTTAISNPQSQSTFLNRVPGEIRNAIYLLLLGNRRLGIYENDPKHRHRLSHAEWPEGQTIDLGENPSRTNKFAILQTCRQIYMEAADILYTTNQFLMPDMDDIKAFNLFTHTISPTRLASITTFSLICKVNYFEPLHQYASTMFKQWKTMWATICLEMSALRHLTVQLRYLYLVENLKLTADTYWVKPLLQVRNLETFDLIVEHDDVVFQAIQHPGDVEGLAAKVERLRRYSKGLLCSPH